jgi:uncharacterized protein (TIGR00255 family)
MALSMTGCGDGVATDGANTCRVELRCVNNRHFKLAFRCRDGFAALEGRAEAAVRRRVRRGSVHLSLDVAGPAAPAGRRLDAVQLAAYLDAAADFCLSRDLPAPHAIESFLGLPGVLVETAPDSDMAERAWPLVAEALDAALDRLDEMRRREGDALAADLRATCGEIRALAAAIRERVPQMVEAHRSRLVERVTRLLAPQGVSLAEGDVAREIALLADRTDIAEELVRLDSHLAQFTHLLGTEAPGRSLDFLSQELTREANTVASKAFDAEIAHTVVEIKTRIERLREQVQNLE